MKQNEVIYQIFPRNYSISKPFIEIIKNLDYIKSLGTTIIYLMPIHEIGQKQRKGTFGSPYAIKDYFSISSDLGSLEEFKELLDEVHKKGLKLIIDMVFNHTAPDNVLVDTHPEYYYRRNGKFANKVGDWSDIIDLETSREDTQEYLLSVLKYWVSIGVDGFRFDVASMIPLSFFKKARKELGNEVIFIAESIEKDFNKYLKSQNMIVNEDDDMYPTFDSLYNYNYYPDLLKYFKGEGPLDVVIDELNHDKNNLRLNCLENHDNERIATVISDESRLCRIIDFFSFIKGQIFIYAGQENGNKHKPELFEKDVVDFSYINPVLRNKYLEAIKFKKKQKEIVDQDIILIDKDTVKVKLTYIDKTIEEKEFFLG